MCWPFTLQFTSLQDVLHTYLNTLKVFPPITNYDNFFLSPADTEDSGMSSGEADVMSKWNTLQEGTKLGR